MTLQEIGAAAWKVTEEEYNGWRKHFADVHIERRPPSLEAALALCFAAEIMRKDVEPHRASD